MHELRYQKTPPHHPGEILKDVYLDPLGISISEAARKMNIPRRTLSMIIHQQHGIDAEIALRLSMALGTTAEIWMDLQSGYDLWSAKQHIGQIQVLPIV